MNSPQYEALWHFFYLYRNQMGYGIVAASVNALAHYKHNDSARDSFVDVLFCGILGWGCEHLLSMLNMSPDAAIIAAAMIGYIGATGISDFIKKRLGLGDTKQ